MFRNLIGMGVEESMYTGGMIAGMQNMQQTDLSQINRMVSFNTQQLQMT